MLGNQDMADYRVSTAGGSLIQFPFKVVNIIMPIRVPRRDEVHDRAQPEKDKVLARSRPTFPSPVGRARSENPHTMRIGPIVVSQLGRGCF
jgi:hypothetical protein